MLKNKDMLICLPFVEMRKAQNFLTAPCIMCIRNVFCFNDLNRLRGLIWAE